jgi:hypothetical protein
MTNQEIARKVWCDLTDESLLSCYFFSKLAELAKESDPDDMESFWNSVDTELMAPLGYGNVSSELLMQEFEEAQKSELGFWQGEYTLFDAKETRYSLNIYKDRLLLQVDKIYIDTNQYKFLNKQLTFSQDGYSFELDFTSPILESYKPGEKFVINKELLGNVQPLCTGSVTINHDGKTEKLAIKGKRGSFSKKGFEGGKDGDPIEIWQNTDEQISKPILESLYTLVFVNDSTLDKNVLSLKVQNEQPVVKYGNVEGTQTTFVNNTLHSYFGKEEFFAKFKIRSDNARIFNGCFVNNGIEKHVVGYLTHRTFAAENNTTSAANVNTPAAPRFRANNLMTATTLRTTSVTEEAIIELALNKDQGTINLPEATELTLYLTTLQITNGVATKDKYNYEITGENLPDNFSINPKQGNEDGSLFDLKGTFDLNTSGVYEFSVQVTDKNNANAKPTEFKLAINVNPEAPSITLDMDIAGSKEHKLYKGVEAIGAMYNFQLNVINGVAPYSYEITGDGQLPPGLYIEDNAKGFRILGTPQAYSANNYKFTLKITDVNSKEQSFPLSIAILNAPLIVISNIGIPDVIRKQQSYTIQLSAAGGYPPYEWEVTGEVPLPAGLSLDRNSGVISGSVGDEALSQTNTSVEITVSNLDKTIIMPSSAETFHFNVQEPEQLNKDRFDTSTFALTGAFATLGVIIAIAVGIKELSTKENPKEIETELDNLDVIKGEISFKTPKKIERALEQRLEIEESHIKYLKELDIMLESQRYRLEKAYQDKKNEVQDYNDKLQNKDLEKEERKALKEKLEEATKARDAIRNQRDEVRKDKKINQEKLDRFTDRAEKTGKIKERSL